MLAMTDQCGHAFTYTSGTAVQRAPPFALESTRVCGSGTGVLGSRLADQGDVTRGAGPSLLDAAPHAASSARR
jgi:hypothetical protein